MNLTQHISLNRITDVSYGSSKADTPDTTDSTVGQAGYKTFTAGLVEAGEVTVKGIWYPGDASQEAFKAIFGTNATFVHTLPNNLGTLSYSGILMGLDHSAPMEKAGEFTAKVKISGSITYAHSNSQEILTVLVLAFNGRHKCALRTYEHSYSIARSGLRGVGSHSSDDQGNPVSTTYKSDP